jgi:parallel beta-helix repeat protein
MPRDTGNPLFNIYYKNGGSPKQLFMGDVDLDGDVDQNDLDTWSSISSGAQWSDGDMDGDRDVDLDDKDIIENAMETAKAPWPPNGSTVLSKITQLTWVEAVDANSHKVYWGTSYNDVNDANESSPEFKGNQEGTSYETDDTLGREKTFYWRIDEVDVNDSVTKGYVWRFTYAPPNWVKNVTKSVYYDFIQDAINDANDGDEIELAEETFYESINFEGKAIKVRSTDPNDWNVVANTIIDGCAGFQNGEDCNSILAGVMVRNNQVGIQFDGSTTVSSGTVSNCIITNNEWGVYSYKGSPLIKNNIIFKNSVGVACENTSVPVIKNNWIYDSISDGAGFGIGFTSCSYTGIVQNNTIVGNELGIWVDSGTAPTISNCIIWDNDDDLVDCTATYSCIEDCSDAGGTGNICGDANDPMFVDPNNDDFHIDGDSPCFNAGDPNYEPEDGETDIDGDDRVMDDRVDMGADEVGCLSIYADEYDDWVSWGKPDCWCYERQCRGDIDGLYVLVELAKIWVTSADQDILVSAFGKTDAELEGIEDGICADVDHIAHFNRRVALSDLNILKDYIDETEPNVPSCDESPVITGPYNFWTN